jgi:hypothetical protein
MKISVQIIGLFALLTLFGCDAEKKAAPLPSKDLLGLRALVNISIPMKSVQWEVFSYPDGSDEGFLPDNYESTTLVAEILPPEPQWLEETEKAIEIMWTSRNAARSWLTPSSRAILATESLDLKKHNCKHYSTVLAKSGKPVTGFACESDGRILLYLLLDSKS